MRGNSVRPVPGRGGPGSGSALIDTSVFCGAWPFRWLRQRSAAELKAHLHPHGVEQAWVASAEAILYPDPMQGNEPLLMAVQGDPFFVPVAVLDPTLATWRRDAEACLKLGARAFKLVPNYHSYSLADPRADGVASLARQAGAVVCVQMRMMDERAHHPLMKVPGVPAADVAGLAGRHPEVRFLACAAYQAELKALRAPNLWVEISFIESGRALPAAAAALGWEQLVFGSHSPFFYFAAIAAKLDVDPADLPPAATKDPVAAVRARNAAVLLGAATGEGNGACASTS